MTPRVIIDPARREMSVGETVLPIELDASSGSVQALPPSGPTLRPVTFGERYRLVELAAATSDPARSLRRALFRCACVAPPVADLEANDLAACEALALHLAGAGIDAPDYAESMLLLAGSAGWLYHQIEGAEAARADRLARRLKPAAEEADDGWNRVVFAPPVPLDPDAIAHELAVGLLDRFDDPVVAPLTEPDAGDGPFDAPAPFEPAASMRAGEREDDREMERSGWEAPEAHAGRPGRTTPPDEDGSRAADDAPADAAPRRPKVLAYEVDWSKRGRKNERERMDDGNPAAQRPTDGEAVPPSREAGRSGVRLLRGSFGAKRSGPDGGSAAPADGGPMRPHAPGATALPGTSNPASEAAPALASKPLPRPLTAADAGQDQAPAAASRAGLRMIDGRTTSPPGRDVEAREPREGAMPRRDAGAGAATRPAMPDTARDAAVHATPSREQGTRTASPADGPGAPLAWGVEGEEIHWNEPVAAIANGLPAALATAEGGFAAVSGEGLGASLMEIADALAAMLDDEADLRGLDR